MGFRRLLLASLLCVSPLGLALASTGNRTNWIETDQYRIKQVFEPSGKMVYQKIWDRATHAEVPPEALPQAWSKNPNATATTTLSAPVTGALPLRPVTLVPEEELTLERLDFKTASRILGSFDPKLELTQGSDEFVIRLRGNDASKAKEFLTGLDGNNDTTPLTHYLPLVYLPLDKVMELVAKVDPDALVLSQANEVEGENTELKPDELNGFTTSRTSGKLIVRAKNSTIRFLRRFLEENDRGPAQVMLDCALVEMDSLRIKELGARLTRAEFHVSPDPANQELSLREMLTLGVDSIPIELYLNDEKHDTRVLARPQIKLVEKQNAFIRVSDDLPYSITTVTTDGGSILTKKVEVAKKYLGINFEVGDLKVYDNQEVTLALRYQVTSWLSQPDPTIEPLVRKRKTQTVIRARHGQTQILSGLVNKEKRNNKSSIPLLDRVPILGNNTSSRRNRKKETETLLILTPYIVPGVRPTFPWRPDPPPVSPLPATNTIQLETEVSSGPALSPHPAPAPQLSKAPPAERKPLSHPRNSRGRNRRSLPRP